VSLPLLELKQCSISFPGVKALDQVDFDLRPGECHALVGENGAGKSTLSKIVYGVYTHYQGQMLLGGEEVRIRDPYHAQQMGIGLVHQELQLIPELNGYENILMGQYRARAVGLVDWKQLRRRADGVIEFLESEIDLTKPVRQLRTAEKQIIQLARVISLESSVLIFDELTAMLQEHEIEVVFRMIKLLKDREIGIIYISHRLDEVFSVCDRYTVLCSGRHAGTGDVTEITKRDLIRMMIGRELESAFPEKNLELGDARLTVSNLSAPAFRNVSLFARRGEVIGIAGLVGAGKTELVNTIFGNMKHVTGEIEIDGTPVKVKSSAAAIEKSVGLVPDERKELGLNVEFSVKENMTLASLALFRLFHVFIAKRKEAAKARDLVNRLRVGCTSVHQKVRTLSGGNQQKVIFGRWLLADTDILLLDEPTRGIDVGAKFEIYRMINNLARAGKTIIVVSPELEELMGLCVRIYVMFEGAIVAELSGDDMNQKTIVQHMIGEGHEQ